MNSELTSDNELNIEAETSLTTNQIIRNIAELNISTPERLRIYTAFRQARVAARRERFFQSASGIIDELESNLASLYTVRSARLENPSSLTQVCWLNQSLRSLNEPSALAEVSADPKIEKIDLPKKLKAELDITGATIGAINYRQNNSLTGNGIIVAIIDSEVAINHPAFQNRVIHKQNFTQEAWGNPGPHGTFVAGIVAGNDPLNLKGIAPEATIYNYKVIANNRNLSSDSFGFAQAIEKALEDGAHIANCSLGIGLAFDSQGALPTREAYACNQAWQLGLTIVKSAGNEGPADGTLTNPAQAEGIIVVGATDRQGQAVQDYSSRGFTGSDRPHLVAPGGSLTDTIISSLINGSFGRRPKPGTSFAAPHVSGSLALLLEQNPNLSPDQLRDILLDNCISFDGVSSNIQGSGLISL